MSNKAKAEEKECVSERFNAIDSDVIFRSCDDVLFKIHRRNLEFATGGFPPSDFETLNEIVQLTEQSSTLEILFQYVYPLRQPDISSVSFDTLALVAEAAEKYQVFSAIYICKIMMQTVLPQHALEIFTYAAKHGYNDIIEKATPTVIEIPLGKVAQNLPGHFIIPWIRYHTSWVEVLSKAVSYPSKALCISNRPLQLVWIPPETPYRLVLAYTAKLNTIKALRNLPQVLAPHKGLSEGFKRFLQEWQKRIERDIQLIPPFLAYLDQDSPSDQTDIGGE